MLQDIAMHHDYS